MDILDDMGVSKLSAKVFLKLTIPLNNFGTEVRMDQHCTAICFSATGG